MTKKCDFIPDCQDSSDEFNCGCKPYEFSCSSGNQCVDSRKKCDRKNDCLDGSDELECNYCKPSEFECFNRQKCIPQQFKCDGKYQCLDLSDEKNCINNNNGGGSVILKTYPFEQTIDEGQEAVFQCRDEGPLRARVEWTRSGGLNLPPGKKKNYIKFSIIFNLS